MQLLDRIGPVGRFNENIPLGHGIVNQESVGKLLLRAGSIYQIRKCVTVVYMLSTGQRRIKEIYGRHIILMCYVNDVKHISCLQLSSPIKTKSLFLKHIDARTHVLANFFRICATFDLLNATTCKTDTFHIFDII